MESDELLEVNPTPTPPPDISRKSTALPALAAVVTNDATPARPPSSQPSTTSDSPFLPQPVETPLPLPSLGTPVHRPPTRLLETPTTADRASRFMFLSDQATVPKDLKRLKASTTKRRRDTTARIHDLDCHIAKMTSDFAEEKMDLDLAISDTMDRSVCQPLEAAMERITMCKEASSTRGPALRELEAKIGAMDRQMMEHIYVSMSEVKREELDTLNTDLHQDFIPGLRIEESKSNKIEGGVIRRYESVAGKIARDFHEEAAERRSAIEMTKQKLQGYVDREEQRGDDILQTIQILRQKIRQERQERQAADKRILDEIVKTTVAMKRALLAAVGEGN